MTLQQQLHEQAELAQLPPVDLDAVTRAGSRAVRRRRWVAGAAALATAVVIGGVAVAVRPTQSQPEPAGPDSGPTPPPVVEFTALSWATGEVLHTPSGDVPVGHEITAFARSGQGYLVASRNQLFTVVNGVVTEEGTVGSDPQVVPRLYGDTDGALVAWKTPTSYEVRDQVTGDDLSQPAPEPSVLLAVDGRTVVAAEGTAVVAIDIDTGARTELAGHPASYEDGVLLEAGDVGPRDADRAVLSPTSLWAAVDSGGEAQVYDAGTGERLPLPVAGESMVVEWLDADSFSVLTLPSPDADYQLLKCHAPISTCEVEVDALRPAFLLPTGLPFLFLPRP